MANDNETVSVDEFMAKRAGFVDKAGHVLKGTVQTDEKGAAPSTFNKETGETRYTMTTEQEDRDKDIIIQAGLDWKGFLENPAAPFAHRASDFPLGSWKDLTPVLNGRPKRHDGTLVPTKGDPVADRYLIHQAAGSIRACSIGFMPKEIQRRPESPEMRGLPGYEIRAAEVWECSPCLIPANPGALAKAAEAHGILPAEFLAEILDTWKAVDGLLVPRKAFEDERAKHAVGKTFSFSGHTFKAQDNGLSVLVKESQGDRGEEIGLLRSIASGIANLLKVPEKQTEKQTEKPETKPEPTAEEKAAESQKAEDLDDDILELEAAVAAARGSIERQIAA